MTTEKLSSKILKLCANENSQTLYVKNIQTILDNIGLSFIFRNQIPVNIIWIKTHVKQILIDQFIQNWRSEIVMRRLFENKDTRNDNWDILIVRA